MSEKNIKKDESSTEKLKVNETGEKPKENSPVDSSADEKIDNDDVKYLVKLIIDKQKLIDHHIGDYNRLLDAIRIIITQYFAISIPPTKSERKSTEEDQLIDKWSATVKFTDVVIQTPMDSDIQSKRSIPLFPAKCRNAFSSYVAPIKMNTKATFLAYDVNGNIIKEVNEEVKDFDLSTISIMVRSKHCNTYNIRDSTEGLQAVREDPRDKGGYFIMDGIEYFIMNSENIKFNDPYIYISNNPISKEKAWLEIISKPGDSFENSHQLYIRLGKDNSITVEIKSIVESLYIPFYMIFRMLEVTIDRDIVDHIVMANDDDQVTKQLRDMLELAFIAKVDERIRPQQWVYDPDAIRLKIGELVRTESKYKRPIGDLLDQQLQHRLVADAMFRLDHQFLPHIGEDSSSRIRKARYLGYLIRRLLLVNIGIAEPTNRDAYTNKRIHAAGVTLAKAFKNQFNLAVVQKIKYELTNLFKATSFSNVHLQAALNQVNKKALEKGLAKLITSSEETINMSAGIVVQNRVSSQAVHRKNEINPLVSARNIEAPSITAKQTERAEQMRHVQETHDGFACPAASKDTGDKVGLTKEMAITTLITPTHNGITNAVMDLVLNDKDFISLDEVLAKDITRLKLAKIFINGAWIGFAAKPHLLVQKYREMRRTGDFDKFATIRWDELLDEVHFWLDYGRLVRPLIIMDNNFFEIIDAEFQGKPAPKFYQRPRLTKEHIRKLRAGLIDFDTLIADGIMEYISPEEQLNCFLSKSMDDAYAEQNNILKIFTHCEIPHCIYGVSALVGPFLNHNAPTRCTYETNQIKQTSGWYSLGWPWRLDKNASYQVNCQHPLVRTLVNDIADSNGATSIVGYLCWDGNGQEDSVQSNKASNDMGTFWVAYSNFYTAELQPGEVIRIPNKDDTMDIKTRSSYSKLNQAGFLEPGTILQNGDVMIPKLVNISSAVNKAGSGEKFKYVDRSIVYKNDEPARVEQLTKSGISVTHDGKQFTYVKTISELPVMVGDKFSTRSGNKSINAGNLPSIDMPITASGVPITYIANPQTITSRMVVSQLMEGIVSRVCAESCVFKDGTAFTDYDMDKMRAELKRYGVHSLSLEQVYCGRTGMAVDTLIAVCPTYLQRLQKYVLKEGYTVQHGPKDALTGQPVSGGRNTGGGGRFGEMEVCVLSTHGSMNIMNQIMFQNSDGVTIYVCRNCGKRADVNIYKQVFKCKLCGSNCDIVAVDSGIASNLFVTECETMNIGISLNI